MKADIKDRRDVVRLVDLFYRQILVDETIGHIFTDVVEIQLDKHMPVMYDFWCSILLREQSYQGNVMLKHIALNKQVELTKEHFDLWVLLWNNTIQSLFEGPIAEEAMRRAEAMKQLMMYKVQRSSEDGFVQ